MEWAALAVGCVRRRKLLALSVLLLVMAATGLQVWRQSRSPVYRVEAKLLAQRVQALPSAVRPSFDDAPTRSAWELIHRRENLLAIVRQASLVPAHAEPAPPSGLLGWLARLRGERALTRPRDPAEVLVEILDEHLLVASSEGTLTISLDWPDPKQAYDVVQAALNNFLEARHVQEVTAIEDVIAVFEGRAAVLREQYDRAVEEARRRPAQAPRAALSRARQPSEELARLKSTLDSKQRAIQDVEEFRRRRLADLQAQLDQARSALSEAHPTIIGLRQDIAALSQESPQVQVLRNEEKELRRQYAQRLAQEGFSASEDLLTRPVVDPGPRTEEDPAVREARQQYEQIVARLNATLVERDAARAAFKYRYNVIWPPQLPTEPVDASPKKLFAVGGLAALVLAVLAAALPDLLTGRIVQRWQVERQLDLPVLGEIHRK